MKDQYIFQIDNNIIQYHASNESFRICLTTFKDTCLMINEGNFHFNNFYVLNRIPEKYKSYNIQLDKCNINDLNAGDLIYTIESYKDDITENDIKNKYNFALIVTALKDRVNLVRVLGDNIEYKPDVAPKYIYKVSYAENND